MGGWRVYRAGRGWSPAPMSMTQAAALQCFAHRFCLILSILIRPSGVWVQCSFFSFPEGGVAVGFAARRRSCQLRRSDRASLALPAGVWVQWIFTAGASVPPGLPRMEASSASNWVILSFRSAACRRRAGVSRDNCIGIESSTRSVNATHRSAVWLSWTLPKHRVFTLGTTFCFVSLLVAAVSNGPMTMWDADVALHVDNAAFTGLDSWSSRQVQSPQKCGLLHRVLVGP